MQKKIPQDVLIIKNNVRTNEELNQTTQQHRKWQKWDLRICNNFKAEPKNIAKAFVFPPRNIRNDFYQATKNSNFLDASVNLTVIERWLDSRLQN